MAIDEDVEADAWIVGEIAQQTLRTGNGRLTPILRCEPLAIEIEPHGAASVVAEGNAVGIEHGNDEEHDVLA